MTDRPRSGDTGGMPRWVKVSGIIVIVLVLLVVVMLLIGGGGRHGPSRHASSGDPGGQTPPSSVTAQVTSSVGWLGAVAGGAANP